MKFNQIFDFVLISPIRQPNAYLTSPVPWKLFLYTVSVMKNVPNYDNDDDDNDDTNIIQLTKSEQCQWQRYTLRK